MIFLGIINNFDFISFVSFFFLWCNWIWSNATSTNYFTIFLQNADVANFLLVFI